MLLGVEQTEEADQSVECRWTGGVVDVVPE